METGFYIDSMKRRMLPMSLGVQSPGGVLTQNVQPGQATQATPSLPRSMEIRRKIAELEGSQAEDDGGMSTLNALAAQFAGESFAPIQAQYLKRASASSPQARTQAQLARLMREAEIADRQEGQQALQAERLAAQQQAEAERRAAAAERAAQSDQLRRELAGQSDATRRELAAIARSNQGAAQPYFQPLQTAQGVMAFNSRTGRMEPVMGADGKPIVGAAADPTLQGALTGARETAKAGVESGVETRKNISRADEMLGQIRTAESLLSAGPTQSGIGAMRDAAGRVVGYSPPGARVASQLETLSGWLVTNVPRMEGPQSNFDVQVYREMAGKVGDRTVPVAERNAALQTLKGLQEKYRELNQQKLSGASPAPAPSRAGSLTPAEQAELEQLRKALGR
jgi:hypothetical protein